MSGMKRDGGWGPGRSGQPQCMCDAVQIVCCIARSCLLCAVCAHPQLHRCPLHGADLPLGPASMGRELAYQLADNAPNQHQVVQVQDTQVIVQLLLHGLQALVLLKGRSRASEPCLTDLWLEGYHAHL